MDSSSVMVVDRVVGSLLLAGLGFCAFLMGTWALLGIGMAGGACVAEGRCDGDVMTGLMVAAPVLLVLGGVLVLAWFVRRWQRAATVWWVPVAGLALLVALWWPLMLVADHLST